MVHQKQKKFNSWVVVLYSVPILGAILLLLVIPAYDSYCIKTYGIPAGDAKVCEWIFLINQYTMLLSAGLISMGVSPFVLRKVF